MKTETMTLIDLDHVYWFDLAGHWGVQSRYVLQAENLVLQECVMEPAGGADAHAHEAHDQLFLVVEGALRVFDGAGGDVVVGAGRALLIPAGTTHGAENAGAGRCRYFVTTVPAASA